MKTFKNINFIKRDYECSNVVACQGEKSPGPNWVECDEGILLRLDGLWIENGVKYFGYL